MKKCTITIIIVWESFDDKIIMFQAPRAIKDPKLYPERVYLIGSNPPG